MSLQTLLLVIGEFLHYYLHCRMSTSRNRLVTIPMPSSSLLNSAVLSKPEGGWTENLWDATELRYSQRNFTKQFVASNSFDVFWECDDISRGLPQIRKWTGKTFFKVREKTENWFENSVLWTIGKDGFVKEAWSRLSIWHICIYMVRVIIFSLGKRQGILSVTSMVETNSSYLWFSLI